MKSKTKNILTDDKIRELAKINFGSRCEVRNITELKGGMFNAIYRLDRVHENDRVVLKVGAAPGTPLLTYERDLMPAEVACLHMIEAQALVPVPKVLAFDFSKKHISSNYFFMTAMEGVPLSSVSKKMSQDNLSKIKRELGGYLAQIHQIKGTYYGYFTEDPRCQYTTWKEAFTQMFGRILKDCHVRHVRLPYSRIEQAIAKNAKYLEGRKRPALIDYDCHEGNIFVKKNGDTYEIEGILDLERAFWGDPIADFPAAFIFVDDIRREKDFLAGYLKENPEMSSLTEADTIRYQLYRMYILVIMAAEIFRYGFLYGQLQAVWAKYGIKKCLRELERHNGE